MPSFPLSLALASSLERLCFLFLPKRDDSGPVSFSLRTGERGVPGSGLSVEGDTFDDVQAPAVDDVSDIPEDIDERVDVAEVDDRDDPVEDDEYDDDELDSDPDIDCVPDGDDMELAGVLNAPLLEAVIMGVMIGDVTEPLPCDDVDVGVEEVMMGTLFPMRCVRISIHEL